MRTARSLPILTLALAVIIAGTACSSSKSSVSASAGSPAPAGPGGPAASTAGTGPAPGPTAASSSVATTTTDPNLAPPTLTIAGFAFKPKSVTVKAGDQVSARNADSTEHTVTSDDKKSFDTSRIPGNGVSLFKAPKTPGSYPFHCSIHQYMKGVLVVQ